jgi:hypothetical protein
MTEVRRRGLTQQCHGADFGALDLEPASPKAEEWKKNSATKFKI